jgi:hypothetical protein
MNTVQTVAAVAAGLAAVFVGLRYAGARQTSGSSDAATVAAVCIAENGAGAGYEAHRMVAEAFWRNVEASGRTPDQIVTGNGGPLAPWPTAERYRPLLLRARVTLAAGGGDAKRAAAAAVEARRAVFGDGRQVVPGATNWTHGGAPFEPWIQKGYRVVGSAGVPSRTRPYLWVYVRPGVES